MSDYKTAWERRGANERHGVRIGNILLHVKADHDLIEALKEDRDSYRDEVVPNLEKSVKWRDDRIKELEAATIQKCDRCGMSFAKLRIEAYTSCSPCGYKATRDVDLDPNHPDGLVNKLCTRTKEQAARIKELEAELSRRPYRFCTGCEDELPPEIYCRECEMDCDG